MPQSGISSKATGKIRMLFVNSHSTFCQQQSLYACPPQFVQSIILHSITTATSDSSAVVLTGKKATSTSVYVKNYLYNKLSDFTWKTKSQIGKEDDQCIHYCLTEINYTVCNKELEMQHSQLAKECINADIVHHCELKHMEKHIEQKNAKESCITWQVEMLQLQIQLEEMPTGLVQQISCNHHHTPSANTPHSSSKSMLFSLLLCQTLSYASCHCL